MIMERIEIKKEAVITYEENNICSMACDGITSGSKFLFCKIFNKEVKKRKRCQDCIDASKNMDVGK